MKPELYIGLISGTSMDAVDCALVQIIDETPPELLDFLNVSIPPDLRENMLALCQDEPRHLTTLGECDVQLARLFSGAVHEILQRNQLTAADITAIGSHGQTVWHQPPAGADSTPFTLQIGDPNTIVEHCGITTVADFRRRDMAAGGEGAPLMPALHRHFFHNAKSDRAVLNLGGIANVSFLPRHGGEFTGFDIGPANVLMDGWIFRHQGKTQDDDGAWAASGQVDSQLLELLLEDPYFASPPPKSTGREYFNSTWLDNKLAESGREIAPQDVQATLLELSARSIADAIASELSEGEVIVCGGGAHNSQLLRSLRAKLDTFTLLSSSELGLNSDCIEAIGFAWLARQALRRQALDFTQITGAAHPLIMGGVYYA